MSSSYSMTLAFWFVVLEVMAVVLLILPLISPAMWSKMFSTATGPQTGFWRWLQKRSQIPFTFALIFMVLIFYDAHRMESEAREAKEKVGLNTDAHNIEYLNAQLFRAQRDLYLSGIGLFLVFVIYRLCKILSEVARLDASCTAALSQAKSASRVLDSVPTPAKSESKDSALLAEIEKKNHEIERLRKDLDAMKSQTASLNREFDRLAEEYAQKQSSGSKKE